MTPGTLSESSTTNTNDNHEDILEGDPSKEIDIEQSTTFSRQSITISLGKLFITY